MNPPSPTARPGITNLFAALAEIREEAGEWPGGGEVFETLLEVPSGLANLRLERIVSHGQATPAGDWLEQEQAEWVLLLQGRAGLRFQDEGEGDVHSLIPGDCVLISPRRRYLQGCGQACPLSPLSRGVDGSR